jgi:hypothetical protein
MLCDVWKIWKLLANKLKIILLHNAFVNKPRGNMHKLMEIKRHDNNTECELHEDDSENEILSGSYFLYRAYCIDSRYKEERKY